jgi:arylsulfatase
MDPRDAEWYAQQFPETDMESWARPGSFVEYGPGWAQVSTVPFRLFKGTQAEGGIRVPLILSGPGVESRGGINRDILHVMDVPATILEVAGVAHPRRFAGRDVVPLDGTSWFSLQRSYFRREQPHEWLGFEFAGERALRKGRWKLTWMAPPFGAASWRLYRIDRDPSELQDLAAKRPEKRDELAALWQEYAARYGVVVPGDEAPETEPADEGDGEPLAIR